MDIKPLRRIHFYVFAENASFVLINDFLGMFILPLCQPFHATLTTWFQSAVDLSRAETTAGFFTLNHSLSFITVSVQHFAALSAIPGDINYLVLEFTVDISRALR